MSDSTADFYIRQQEEMQSRRYNFENQWREVAERVRPDQNLFNRYVEPGQKNDQMQFDDTAPLALNKFLAAVISMAFPANGQWHKLTTDDPALAEIPAVKVYFEKLTDILFKMRYSPLANFQSQLAESLLDVGAFGTGSLFIDDIPGKGIRYKSVPLSEVFLMENAHGIIDTHHRKFELTAHQAVNLFKDKCPQKIKDCAEKFPLNKFWFLHAVCPNTEQNKSKSDYRGMEFKSCYIAMETRDTVMEGGYRSFPFAVPRFETAPREVYGRGPGMKVLRSIKALNEMKKTVIRAGQLVVAPPIMLTDDASLTPFNIRPNALNYGFMDEKGSPRAAPFNTGGRVDIGIDLMDKEREVINDAFFVTLFRILVEEPQITATEAMLRAQEKGQLLAPTMGRMQADIGGMAIPRELDIMFKMDEAQKALGGPGFLPPVPQELIDAGAGYKTEYQSPLNQAQKAGEGVAILNTINALTPLATAMGPDAGASVMRMFNVERTARKLAESNGAPASIMATPEELQAEDAQKAQSAEVQTMLAAAPVAASAAKDLAQANALTASSTGPAPDLFPA